MRDPKIVFDGVVVGIHVRLYENGEWQTISEDGMEAWMPFSLPTWALAPYIAKSESEIARLTSALAEKEAAVTDLDGRLEEATQHAFRMAERDRKRGDEIARLTLALTAQGERLKAACRLLMEMKEESLCQPPFDFALTTKVDEFLSADAAAQDQRGGGETK